MSVLGDLGKAIIKKLPDNVYNYLQMADQKDSMYVGRFASSISKTLPTKEPQRSYMWEIGISDPEGDSVDKITLYAKQTAVPPTMTENLKRWYAGVEYSYAGRDVSPRIFRVTFWDNEDLEIYRFFRKWNELINGGETSTKVKPEDYFGKATIKLLRSNGKSSNDYNIGLGTTILDVPDIIGKVWDDATEDDSKFTMKDIFPVEVSEITLSYAESTEITFDVMFSYRYREFEST